MVDGVKHTQAVQANGVADQFAAVVEDDGPIQNLHQLAFFVVGEPLRLHGMDGLIDQRPVRLHQVGRQVVRIVDAVVAQAQLGHVAAGNNFAAKSRHQHVVAIVQGGVDAGVAAAGKVQPKESGKIHPGGLAFTVGGVGQNEVLAMLSQDGMPVAAQFFEQLLLFANLFGNDGGPDGRLGRLAPFGLGANFSGAVVGAVVGHKLCRRKVFFVAKNDFHLGLGQSRQQGGAHELRRRYRLRPYRNVKVLKQCR